jgi:hypothetical protein
MIWLEGQNVFGFTVEKTEIGRPGGKPFFPIPASTGIAVLHTTEGKTVGSAIAQFKMRFDPPHFCVGENRIVQCRPVGVQAAALHDPANRASYIQIEIVGFSKETLWQLDDSSLKPAVAVIAHSIANFGIPNAIPHNYPDTISDCKPFPSSNNTRRKKAESEWPNVKGFHMHMEIPFQGPTWHWDCGAIKRSELLKMAQQLLDG